MQDSTRACVTVLMVCAQWRPRMIGLGLHTGVEDCGGGGHVCGQGGGVGGGHGGQGGSSQGFIVLEE